MIYRSYSDWRKAGKTVIKGEKASGRTITGEALFSEQQVTKLTTSISTSTSTNTANKRSTYSFATDYEGFNGHYHSEDYEQAMYG